MKDFAKKKKKKKKPYKQWYHHHHHCCQYNKKIRNINWAVPEKSFSESKFSSPHILRINWSQRIDAFKLWGWRTRESPLDTKNIKPVNPKRNQLWIFIGRTDAEAEAPILRPPNRKSQLIEKDPDAGKDRGQEEKEVTEDEMVGWHHWLNGHEFEQIPGDSEGQGSLACCSQRGGKESDTTEWLNCVKGERWKWGKQQKQRWEGIQSRKQPKVVWKQVPSRKLRTILAHTSGQTPWADDTGYKV